MRVNIMMSWSVSISVLIRPLHPTLYSDWLIDVMGVLFAQLYALYMEVPGEEKKLVLLVFGLSRSVPSAHWPVPAPVTSLCCV
jgi:hypothetical protein